MVNRLPRTANGGHASETSTLNLDSNRMDKQGVLTPSTSSEHGASDIEKSARDVEASAQPTKEEAAEGPAVATAPPPVNPMMDPSSFPDGGVRAWTVVLGAFCCLFVSFGWINCIGVFQTYYQTHQLKNYSASDIAWIPSLEACIMFLGGVWVGRVFDNYGPRYLLLTGTFLHVFGLMMASISTKYYQFILSQGLCSALGASMIFYPAMNCVVSWFFKRRALAFGLVASGSSLGGVIFPIMVTKLIPEVGFGWTMRICAFLILALMVVANLTVVARIPPSPRPVRLMDWIDPFKDLNFTLLGVGSFFMFLGLFDPFTFVILQAEERGVPLHIAQYMVSILNAASFFGRTVPGWAADRFGRFTTFLLMSGLTSVIVLALWTPSHGTGAVVTFSLIFGFSSGCIVSLLPTLVAQISDVKQIGVRTGTCFSLVAVATLIGSPIGGQLIIANDGDYTYVAAFAGTMITVGTCFYLAVRVRVGGWKLLKKV